MGFEYPRTRLASCVTVKAQALQRDAVVGVHSGNGGPLPRPDRGSNICQRALIVSRNRGWSAAGGQLQANGGCINVGCGGAGVIDQ